MDENWVEDSKRSSAAASFSGSVPSQTTSPRRLRQRNIFHVLSHREVSPRTKHQAKRHWNKPPTSGAGFTELRYLATDAKHDLFSWAESQSLHRWSAKYCPLMPPPRSTIAAAFSSDGKTLASTHGDHTVKIIDCQTGKCLKVLGGHRRTPWVVRYHPLHSDILASGSLDHEVRLWDANTSDCIGSQDFSRPIASIAFHARGEILAVASGHKLYIWNYNRRGSEAPTIILRTRRSLRAVHFHPHGAPYLLTAEVNNLDSADSQLTHATSTGYSNYPSALFFANINSRGYPHLESNMSSPCLIWPAFLRDDGSLYIPRNDLASSSTNAQQSSSSDAENQQSDQFVTPMDVCPGEPSVSNDVQMPSTSNSVPLPAIARPSGSAVHRTSSSIPISTGSARGSNRHYASRPHALASVPGIGSPQLGPQIDEAEAHAASLGVGSELTTSLFSAGAAELPCTVKLRVWRHDIKDPCGTLQLGACCLTISHAVLCSEMGAHFSPCGRFLVACVACLLPQTEGDQGSQLPVQYESTGAGTSPTRHPLPSHGVIYELRVYSLEEATFGEILTSRAIRAAHCLTSIQFSPTSEHILLAYGRRHSSLLRSIVMDGETTGVPVYTILEVYRVSDMELVRVLPSAEDEVNVACFHPSPGGGLVYGTKEGKLRILQHNGADAASMGLNCFIEENMLEVACSLPNSFSIYDYVSFTSSPCSEVCVGRLNDHLHHELVCLPSLVRAQAV
ncbi:hypothetical protein ACQ4PT_002312 [Festuca glaucescens]